MLFFGRKMPLCACFRSIIDFIAIICPDRLVRRAFCTGCLIGSVLDSLFWLAGRRGTDPDRPAYVRSFHRDPIQEGEWSVYNYTSVNDFTAQSEEKPLRILYIEDYPDNRLLIRRVLMAEGYTVLEAGDAQQALKLALSDPPDLILMDINLPEVDGYTLTARIRATPRLAHIPVVALTANVMKGDRERVLEAGCDGYIQKPVDIDQLPWQISKYLRKSRGT